jgi:hypothetical protein
VRVIGVVVVVPGRLDVPEQDELNPLVELAREMGAAMFE